MEPLPNNTRYILELERQELVKRRLEFDEKYGTLSFIFIQTFQGLAILAYLSVISFLVFTKKIQSRTNVLIVLWSSVNLVVLGDRVIRFFTDFTISEDVISHNGTEVCQMLAGLGRLYGSLFSVVWLYLNYFESPKPKYNVFLYFLMLVPTFVCAYFLFYFYNVDFYIYEVFGPGCDIASIAIYLLVGFIFVMCKIFGSINRSTSTCPLLLSLSSLITNFPISLITIYVRYNLDISWSNRFHIYFVDLLVNMLTASNGFVALFLILLYNGSLRRIFLEKSDYFV